MRKIRFGTLRNCKRTRCARSCLINGALDLMAAKVSAAFSCGKMLKWTLATDKSVVTTTLETEIIKFEMLFFLISPCKISTRSFWITPPIFFCLFVSMAQKYDFLKFQSACVAKFQSFLSLLLGAISCFRLYLCALQSVGAAKDAGFIRARAFS